mgnify:FL=1
MIHRLDTFGNRLVIGYGDGSVAVYDYKSYRAIHRMELHDAAVCQVYVQRPRHYSLLAHARTGYR